MGIVIGFGLWLREFPPSTFQNMAALAGDNEAALLGDDGEYLETY